MGLVVDYIVRVVGGRGLQKWKSSRAHKKIFNHFLRTFQGPHSIFKDFLPRMWFKRLYKNAHSQTILAGLKSLDLLAPPTSLIFLFTCLKLIVNSCIKKKRFMYITYNFSELWFIFCLRQPESIKEKKLSRPLHSKLKKIQGLFKDST